MNNNQEIEQNRIDEALSLIKGIGEETEPRFFPTKGERFMEKAYVLVERKEMHKAIDKACKYAASSLEPEDARLLAKWLDKEAVSIDKAAKELRRQAYSPKH